MLHFSSAPAVPTADCCSPARSGALNVLERTSTHTHNHRTAWVRLMCRSRARCQPERAHGPRREAWPWNALRSRRPRRCAAAVSPKAGGPVLYPACIEWRAGGRRRHQQPAGRLLAVVAGNAAAARPGSRHK